MKNNYCIIMAGGAGCRFWPFSTNEKPKQFLDFFGTGRSLLRMTYERLDGIIPASNVFVVTNKIYKETILEQLPELEENQVLLSLKNVSREALRIDAEELLERFVRGDFARNSEGSGLGLNIAKSLMEIQKGQMQLLLDGDLFKVTLVFPAVENEK